MIQAMLAKLTCEPDSLGPEILLPDYLLLKYYNRERFEIIWDFIEGHTLQFSLERINKNMISIDHDNVVESTHTGDLRRYKNKQVENFPFTVIVVLCGHRRYSKITVSSFVD